MCQSEIEPRGLENTLFLKEMYPVHGGTHSANWEMPLDMAEHTLLTGNRPGTWWNALWRPKINQGHGGTHSADRKSTHDVAEHILANKKRPGTWRNTLYRPEIDPVALTDTRNFDMDGPGMYGLIDLWDEIMI